MAPTILVGSQPYAQPVTGACTTQQTETPGIKPLLIVWAGLNQPDVLLKPTAIYSRSDVLGPACPHPRSAGVYAWYYCDLPYDLDVSECNRHNE